MNLQRSFIIDPICTKLYSYADLLESIISTEQFPARCQHRSVYETLLHLILSMINDKMLILLDHDLTDREIYELCIPDKLLKTVYTNRVRTTDSCLEKLQHLSQFSKWKVELFTSGTTGTPKRVSHTFPSLTRAVRISERHSNDVWGLAYNPTHIAGIQVFFQAFLNSNTIVVLYGIERESIYESMNKYSVTHLSATPTFYRMLLPVSRTVESVVRITSGGERLDPILIENLRQIFPKAKHKNIYASTEAGTILESTGDVFELMDPLKVKIIDNELYIHRSLVLSKVDDFDGEWYATGDMVKIISAHPLKFIFSHRKNELFNVGGYVVNPTEVEGALLENTMISVAHVYGKANKLIGNVLVAEVVVCGEISESEIRGFLSDKLQGYKIPRVINFVNRIGYTRSGKLRRNNGGVNE